MRQSSTPVPGDPDKVDVQGRQLARLAMPLTWLAAFVAVAAYVVYRVELLPLSSSVRIEGMLVDVSRMFYTVDHPFHVVRSKQLVDAWSSLESLRWVPSHLGGYPAEFFPFGVAGIAAVLHFLSFGLLGVGSAYTVTVAGLFLLPGFAYWLMARIDRLSPGVGLLAFSAHITIASTWLQGGYSEMFEWGLVTNAAGSIFSLLGLPLLTKAVQETRPRWAMLAAACIALAVLSNPRSLVSIVLIAIAIILHSLSSADGRAVQLIRVVTIGTLAIALCAPLLVPLLRYSDHYYFLHYQEYADTAAYVGSSIDAVTLPVFLLALVGCVLAFVNGMHRMSQIAVITFGLYVFLTALAVAVTPIQELIPQLELPRLMPFQRLLTFYLAALATIDISRRLCRHIWRPWSELLTAGVAVVVLIVVFTTGFGPRALEEQGLRPIPRIEASAASDLVQMQSAVERADEIAADGTAILVLGTQLSWHQQLWAPTWSDRLFYYDDWLWYWHRYHDGPYDYRNGHFYPDAADTISIDYLETHSIGAVVVTDEGSETAGTAMAGSRLLRSDSEHGAWAVYDVLAPSSIATLDGDLPEQLEFSSDRDSISMSFANAQAGSILVRQNWFPRWMATINGERVDVTRADNGYIEIASNGGEVEVELTYALTSLDIVARGVSAAGIATMVTILIIGVTPIRRLARRSGLARRGSEPR